MSKPVVEEVLPQLFRAEIPLPRNPLKAVNSYIIRDRERSLVIDTGMNRDECREAMMAALKELQVDLRRTDLYITHMHVDHLGLAVMLAGLTHASTSTAPMPRSWPGTMSGSFSSRRPHGTASP